MKRAYRRALLERDDIKYFDAEREELIQSVDTNWPPVSSRHDPLPYDTLFCPVKGSDNNQRHGNKCYLHSIEINGLIDVDYQTGAWTPDPAPIFRVIMVLDKQTSGEVFTVSNFIGPYTAGACNLLNFPNPDYITRYEILDEKYINSYEYQIGSVASTIAQCGKTLHYRLCKQFDDPLLIVFNNRLVNNIASLQENSVHILCGAHPAQGLSTPTYTHIYKSRCIFTDET